MSFSYICFLTPQHCDAVIEANTHDEADIRAFKEGWEVGHLDGQGYYACPAHACLLFGTQPLGHGPRGLAGASSPAFDAARIKETLAHSPGSHIQLQCFNAQEEEEIKSHLTPEERERVFFSRLYWPRSACRKANEQER